MSNFQISRSFYQPSYSRAPRAGAVARRPGRTEGSTMKKKATSAAIVIGSAAAVSYAEAKWGLPAIRFSKENEKPSMMDHFGTADFLVGAGIMALSLWGKIPATYDSYALDASKGILAHWASVTVFNSIEFGKDDKGLPHKQHPVTRGAVAGQLNQGGRRAISPEQAWQGQFAGR